MTTLWDKFQGALRYVRATTDAAIATLAAAPAAQPPKKLLSEHTGIAAAPATGDAGALIEGFKTVNLVFDHATDATSTPTIWLMDGGGAWRPLRQITCEGASGILDPLDAEGFKRIAATGESGDFGAALTLSVFPFVEED